MNKHGGISDALLTTSICDEGQYKITITECLPTIAR